MANPVKVIEKLLDFEQKVADFIADGPSTGIQGYVRDRYRHRCRELANLPGWARALGVGRGPFTRVCEPYWADNGWDGPVNPGPPFTGGQCCDLTYNVSYTGLNISQEPISGTAQISGQILGSETRSNQPAQPTITSGVNRRLCNGQVDFIGLVNVFEGQETGFSITSVTPVSGVDDCGDPPDLPLQPGPNPPPDPGPLPGPEPFTDPRDPTGIPQIPIPPYDDPIFGPTPIETPDDESGGGGSPGGGDGLPGDPDATGDPAGGVGGGEPGQDVDFGEPPAGRVWVGCVVRAVVDPRIPDIPNSGPGNRVYASVIGNASLIYAGHRGTNVRVLSEFTELVRSSSAVVLEGCRVSALPGVQLTVRPISAVSCPDDPCEE